MPTYQSVVFTQTGVQNRNQTGWKLCVDEGDQWRMTIVVRLVQAGLLDWLKKTAATQPSLQPLLPVIQAHLSFSSFNHSDPRPACSKSIPHRLWFSLEELDSLLGKEALALPLTVYLELTFPQKQHLHYRCWWWLTECFTALWTSIKAPPYVKWEGLFGRTASISDEP